MAIYGIAEHATSTVIWEIIMLKIFMCKSFVLKILYFMKVSLPFNYLLCMSKIFCMLNFCTFWQAQKFFNNKNFPDYSMSQTYSGTSLLQPSKGQTFLAVV